ncbi:class I SAM-dependent methyltransferase [Actinomadura sp. 6N118]|uniref:class I SAM-dependent methyltransferase n=1 Tax=Actinomadura sp. 6N118 TaxID=3375151 RepID=UPI003795DC2A
MLISLLVAAGVTANAVRLRRRLGGLRRMDVPTGNGHTDGHIDRHTGGHAVPDDAYQLITAKGGVVSGQLRRAAFNHAFAGDLQVLDLIPADLPVERALDLARDVDPRRYRTDPAAPGRGAGFATLVCDDVLARAGVRAGSMEPGDFGAATACLRQYALLPLEGAGAGAAMVVVPCRTTPRLPVSDGRRAWLRGLGISVPRRITGLLLGYGLVGLALVADLWWGMLAVAAYSAVPYIVFAGSVLSPRDLHRSALLRVIETPLQCWKTLTSPQTGWERRVAERERETRAWYGNQIAQGVARFLEPLRDDCPWCGSLAFRKLLTSGDVPQGKPGSFRLERCGDCGHIFQNPALNAAGLDFYDRDLPDSPGGAAGERILAGRTKLHRARAKLVAAHVRSRPRTWLDVGSGHGHFCRTARTVLSDTEFDGLDARAGAGAEEGVRRGWLRRAYRGRFIELMDELFGRYDVVSMHRYLEHAADPLAELDAAAKVLMPGGHLLIELADPESLSGKACGRWWTPWTQPRHRHLIPIGNLEAALGARGLRVVARRRRRAHQRYDLTRTALGMLRTLAPDPRRPWAPWPPTAAAWARCGLAAACAGPLLAAAVVLDLVVLPLVPGTSNAYRILARKDEG